jgi:hypothetical protein
MQTAERNYVQHDLIGSPPAAGHCVRIGPWERIAFAVLVAAVLLVATALVVMCLGGTVTDLP